MIYPENLNDNSEFNFSLVNLILSNASNKKKSVSKSFLLQIYFATQVNYLSHKDDKGKYLKSFKFILSARLSNIEELVFKLSIFLLIHNLSFNAFTPAIIARFEICQGPKNFSICFAIFLLDKIKPKRTPASPKIFQKTLKL